MAIETARLTHCPTCGAKLHRTDLSLCAYCATPLRLGASAAPPDDETQRLFAKMQAHPAYADALRWTPMDPRIEARARKLHAWGLVLVALTVVELAVWWAGVVPAMEDVQWPGVIAGTLVTLALFALGSAITLRGNALNEPMLRRPARVLDRTSRTESTDKVGATRYTFQLRFADGSEGLFTMPGRGTMYEPPTVGATGLAYSRGADLIEFKRF